MFTLRTSVNELCNLTLCIPQQHAYINQLRIPDVKRKRKQRVQSEEQQSIRLRCFHETVTVRTLFYISVELQAYDLSRNGTEQDKIFGTVPAEHNMEGCQGSLNNNLNRYGPLRKDCLEQA